MSSLFVRNEGDDVRLLEMVNRLLLKIATVGVIISMAAIAIIIPYEVFGRYILNEMATWSGEAATFSLVWASMMGAAAGLRKGYQVGMTSVLESLPAKHARLVQGVGYLWSIFFLAIMVYFGFEQASLNYHQTSPGMGIRMSIPYAALPIGFLVMLLVTIEDALLFLGLGKGKQPKEGQPC